jgi:hypothetical protein
MQPTAHCLLCFFVCSVLFSPATSLGTFGKGIPNFPVVPDEEREIFSYNISDVLSMGLVTHFWSTACGGRAIDW